MLNRIYVMKKDAYATEAAALLQELQTQLQLPELEGLRIINRYDIEDVEESVIEEAMETVFANPSQDLWSRDYPEEWIEGREILALELLPGQFDQRAHVTAAALRHYEPEHQGTVRTARLYAFDGELTEEDLLKIRHYLLNPVECREADLALPEEADDSEAEAQSEEPGRMPALPVLDGFCELDRAGLQAFLEERSLAMDLDDLSLIQKYFKEEEKRDPALLEVILLDTYWSDHCRHTTFNTILDEVDIQDPQIARSYERYLKVREELERQKPVSLMDLGTIAAKYWRAKGQLSKLDISEEINACTVHTEVEIDGEEEDWLFFFKNETHNHPTEIEPSGGAATCLGGAIRDPLSGRAMVHGGMRISGSGDPRQPIEETLPGKLPQRTIALRSAEGFASYGNQIGLPSGISREVYHPGFVAKHMDLGAIVGAAPQSYVYRAQPQPGDKILLLGGRTGRDGIGGATGSSKSHDQDSAVESSAEVQKGNAPEERKLLRLFARPEASTLIKRCNDFGAGGVSVAIGELADGIRVNLDTVPAKYPGLNGMELALSESQERMAVVINPENVEEFMSYCRDEDVEATIVAEVSEEPRLHMEWQGETVVDIARSFLNMNGAPKHGRASVQELQALSQSYLPETEDGAAAGTSLKATLERMLSDINLASQAGLGRKFDFSAGGKTVLAPLGGRYQRTPIQAMVHELAPNDARSENVSMMSYGYNPFIGSESPYHAAYLAVVESLAKLIATGADTEETYLSFQEYFPRLGEDPERWGLPLAALLGALEAQLDMGVAAIGGKDSMSGSFEDLDVPPTLVSFAVSCATKSQILSPEFKQAGSPILLLSPEFENGLPKAEDVRAIFETVTRLRREGKVLAAATPGLGGLLETLWSMAIGNELGFTLDDAISLKDLQSYCYGAMVLELDATKITDEDKALGRVLGVVSEEPVLSYGNETVAIEELLTSFDAPLSGVYPLTGTAPELCNMSLHDQQALQTQLEVRSKILDGEASSSFRAQPENHASEVRCLIPIFPGSSGEIEVSKAMREAGATPVPFLVRDLNGEVLKESQEDFVRALEDVQILFIPGGIAGGDEPEGAVKLILAFFRQPEIREATNRFIQKRDGLVGGFGNGFQALLELGLLTHEQVLKAEDAQDLPSVGLNLGDRHESSFLSTRLLHKNSPWLQDLESVPVVERLPISTRYGRVIVSKPVLEDLIERDQIVAQYIDDEGNVAYDGLANPMGSCFAIESLCSPNGRVFGRMTQPDRLAPGLYKNIPGLGADARTYFKGAVDFFREA